VEPGGSGSQTFDGPIAWYDRSSFSPASVIAGPRYRHAASPGGEHLFPAEYEGVVFFSEYYQGFVRAVHDTGGAVWAPLDPVTGQTDPDNWGTGIQYVGDWAQGPDGALYYLQQFPGELHRIEYASPTGVGDGVTGLSPRAVPNPFRAGEGTWIRLGASPLDAESVDVLDASGRLVRRLRVEPATAENEAVRWDGRDAGGNPAPPGVYFVTAQGPGGRRSVRVTLVP
jgi:hypothetical protein